MKASPQKENKASPQKDIAPTKNSPKETNKDLIEVIEPKTDSKSQHLGLFLEKDEEVSESMQFKEEPELE